MSKKLKKKFAVDGIDYNRRKFRSKSLVNLKYVDVDGDDKKTKNSTKDTYQQNQDFNCDISESFMQQCQYLISEKFIV